MWLYEPHVALPLHGSFPLFFCKATLCSTSSSLLAHEQFFSFCHFSVYSLFPSFLFSPSLSSRARFSPPGSGCPTFPPRLGQSLSLSAGSAPSSFRFPRLLSSVYTPMTRPHQLRPNRVVSPSHLLFCLRCLIIQSRPSREAAMGGYGCQSRYAENGNN